jgi:hypothetical protein
MRWFLVPLDGGRLHGRGAVKGNRGNQHYELPADFNRREARR